jgi:hypothetical protein
MASQLTQQEIIAYRAHHHITNESPKWDNHGDHWPVCTKCEKDIRFHPPSNTWACSDSECEMA